MRFLYVTWRALKPIRTNDVILILFKSNLSKYCNKKYIRNFRNFIVRNFFEKKTKLKSNR